MFRSTIVCSLVAAAVLSSPVPAPAASKEIQELMREIGLLEDKVNQMQQAQTQQMAELKALVQQALTASMDSSRSVGAIQSNLQQSIRDQEAKVVTPVVGLNTRMDALSQDMRTLQQAVSDLTTQMTKLQSQLTDLNNAVKVISTPAPPPPGATGQPSDGGGSPGGAPGGGSPPMSSSDLYDSANRDRNAGKLDLALQEYADYLRYYGNTNLAPNAQYYIAWIHSSQGDHAKAVQEYDMVLEKYPDNNKTPDAMYGKGVSLVKMGRRTDGAREFQELVKRFPSNPLAGQACTQLTNLGMRCPSARSAAPAKGAAKRARK